MMSSKEQTDRVLDEMHETGGWRRFKEDSSSEDTDEDVGLIAQIDRDFDQFQGVVLINLSNSKTISEIIELIIERNGKKLFALGNDEATKLKSSAYYDLRLDNKYFTADIQLLDIKTYLNNDEKSESYRPLKLTDCHAVIIYFDPKEFNTNEIDEAIRSVEQVRGEPRILACNEFEPESSSEKYSMIVDWCVENEYEFIPKIFQDDLLETQEGGYSRLIDALSAYRWPYLKMKQPNDNIIPSNQEITSNHFELENRKQNQNDSSNKTTILNSDIMKKIEDFDELLTKLSHYRDNRPHQDKTDQQFNEHNNDELLEIAQKLSSILGDDYGDLLAEDDSSDGEHDKEEKAIAN